MNTENIIEFIRRGSAFKRSTKQLRIGSLTDFLLFTLGIISFFFEDMKIVRNFYIVYAIMLCVSVTLCFFWTQKGSPLKYHLLCSSISYLNNIFGVFLMLVIIHWSHNTLSPLILLYFAPSVIITATLMITNVFLLRRKKFIYKRKTVIAPVVVTVGSTALIRWRFKKEFKETFSIKQQELIVIAGLIFLMSMFSLGLVDLQRFYYYNKLEKMGLVTEEILKPDN